jgi:hypothetical protein
MQIRNPLGTRFGIWKQRHAWFWFIDDPPLCESAAVGVAANEQEAICEAYSSIREMATRVGFMRHCHVEPPMLASATRLRRDASVPQ